MSRKLRILTFSTLYPSSVRPSHGIFIETRLRKLLESGEVEARVVAPVPWFPCSHPAFGSYAKFAATPRSELHNGVRVEHPRYFLPPRIGMHLAPHTLARCALKSIRSIQAQGFDFDLIDAHYFYPDGVAAAIVASALDKPFVCTARGSDINLFTRYPRPRRLIVDAAMRAAACIGVCRDLMVRLETLGVPAARTNVIRNGVDLERFTPLDRIECRRLLGMPEEGLVFLSVGHLVKLKGHDLAIRMLCEYREAHLAIVGSGPLLGELEALARELGVADRVRFAGAQPQQALARYYSAADVLLLCSEREGWANVLLEAMACGTPVVATAVNGTPEVVTEPAAGQLAHERTMPGLIQATERLLANRPARALTRAYAERFGWEESSWAQVELFHRVVGQAGGI